MAGTIVQKAVKTVGIAKKAIAAAVGAGLIGALSVLAHSIGSGEWNATETGGAVVVLVAAVSAFAAAWKAGPGGTDNQVVVEAAPGTRTIGDWEAGR